MNNMNRLLIILVLILLGCSEETLTRKVNITYTCLDGCIGNGNVSGEPLVVSMPYGLEENFNVNGFLMFEMNVKVGEVVHLEAKGGKVRLLYNGASIEREVINEVIR